MSPWMIIALFLVGGLTVGVSLAGDANPVQVLLAVAFNWLTWLVLTVVLCIMGMAGTLAWGIAAPVIFLHFLFTFIFMKVL